MCRPLSIQIRNVAVVSNEMPVQYKLTLWLKESRQVRFVWKDLPGFRNSLTLSAVKQHKDTKAAFYSVLCTPSKARSWTHVRCSPNVQSSCRNSHPGVITTENSDRPSVSLPRDQKGRLKSGTCSWHQACTSHFVRCG